MDSYEVAFEGPATAFHSQLVPDTQRPIVLVCCVLQTPHFQETVESRCVKCSNRKCILNKSSSEFCSRPKISGVTVRGLASVLKPRTLSPTPSFLSKGAQPSPTPVQVHSSNHPRLYMSDTLTEFPS